MQNTGTSKNDWMYENLVEDDEDGIDIAGMIAYAFYKKAKIEYIQTQVKKNGNAPDETELKKFQESQCTTTQIDNYKHISVTMINNLIDSYIKEFQTELHEFSIQLEQKDAELSAKEREVNQKLRQIESRTSRCDMQEKEIQKEKDAIEIACPKRKQNWLLSYVIGTTQSIIGSIAFALIAFIFLMYTQYPNDIAKHISDNISKNLKTEKQ